jgi:hypothetical protein
MKKRTKKTRSRRGQAATAKRVAKAKTAALAILDAQDGPIRGAEMSRPRRVEIAPPTFPDIADPKKRMWMAAYAVTANIREACAAIGICERTAYYWRASPDPAFAEAMKVAEALACDRLEAEARRRAYDGVERPVYQNGRLVGTELVYENTLLMFLLKGMRPEKYRERHEITGAGGGPVQLARADLTALSIAELEVLERAHKLITDGKP